MSSPRPYQFWMSVHRWLGLGSMLFLFLAAVTGCILCFDTTIDAALNADLFRAPGTAQLPDPIEAVHRFEKASPQLQVTGFPLTVEPGYALPVTVAARASEPPPAFDEAFLNPANGDLIGTRSTGPGWNRRHFVAGIYEFHYTLLAGRWGRWLMGVMALGWLIGNGVGLYLTLPSRGPFCNKWKRAWSIDWKASLRWLLRDLHRASGLWLFLGVLVLAFTSVSMNFFEEAFIPAVSALSPPAPSPFDRSIPAFAGPDAIGFQRALFIARKDAARRGLNWQPAAMSYAPDRNLDGVMFTANGRVSYRELGPVTLYLDAATGTFIYADDPYRDSRGRKLGRALYPLHSGEVIGPAGTVIIFLLGLATTEMCVSGFYVWWKKRLSRLAMDRGKRHARART